MEMYVRFTEDEFPVIGFLDGKRLYIICGMGGAGSAVALSATREVVRRILGHGGADDYPAAYFAPTRLLDPERHRWPEIEKRHLPPPPSVDSMRL